MKFSIVTPSYNQGRFIRDCIESVKMQEGVEWEHIVIDACSTDETLSILKEYPHLQWISEPDKGMSDGINKGFLKATGDWVMWLNADDYLLPGALSSVSEAASLQNDAAIVYGDALFVTEDKELIRRKRDHPFDSRILLFYGCYIQSTSTFLHRRILEAGHLLDAQYRVCMDFEYYVRLWALGYKFAYLPKPLAGFRWHDSNTSAVYAVRRKQERLQVQRKYLGRMGWHRTPPESVLLLLAKIYQTKRVFKRLIFRCMNPC